MTDIFQGWRNGLVEMLDEARADENREHEALAKAQSDHAATAEAIERVVVGLARLNSDVELGGPLARQIAQATQFRNETAGALPHLRTRVKAAQTRVAELERSLRQLSIIEGQPEEEAELEAEAVA